MVEVAGISDSHSRWQGHSHRPWGSGHLLRLRLSRSGDLQLPLANHRKVLSNHAEGDAGFSADEQLGGVVGHVSDLSGLYKVAQCILARES